MSKEDDLINAVSDLKEQQVPQELISAEDANEYLQWMLGITQDPPSSLERLINNLSKKLNMGMAYILAMNMQRSNKLVAFMKSAEDILFDENTLVNKTDDDIKDLYEKANKTLNSTLEYTRKYISQNKDEMKSTGESDKIKDMLLTLPKSKLDKLLAMLEKGEV